MLDLDQASAVVQLVGCVCGLLGESADLTDKGYLVDLGAIDGEFGVCVGLLSIDELLDGDWTERVFAMLYEY